MLSDSLTPSRRRKLRMTVSNRFEASNLNLLCLSGLAEPRGTRWIVTGPVSQYFILQYLFADSECRKMVARVKMKARIQA
jgi:hypothetical protein